MKTRFIIAGLGNRGLGCFAKGLMGFPSKGLPEFPERAEITAFVDANNARGKASAGEIKRPDMPVFPDISTAQKKAPADWCIVTTPDFTHQKVVCEALEAGLNVVVDKPLATSAWECDLILKKMQETGKDVRVGHNMRYHDWTLKACEMVRGGDIGDVLMLEAAEILSYSHGGDYFHRWHSDFSKSAGLMNHKCCHHLDFINWVLDDEPTQVSAFGGRSFYRERPDIEHGERCTDCAIGRDCPHFFNMDEWDGVRRRIYMGAEKEDGYIRDRCVWSDRHTVNDHEVLNIQYAKGTRASFTMVAFSPREFSYFFFTGTKGRLEMGQDPRDRKPYLRLLKADGELENVTFEREHGEHGHGGSDVKLIADILGLPGSEPIQKAHPVEARRAVLIADLAARSIASGGPAFKAEEAGKDYPPAPPQA